MGADPQPGQLTGGRLLAGITDEIVATAHARYGKGPLKAKTYVLDNLITVVMSNGFIPVEQAAMDADEPGRVLGMRRDFQEHIEGTYTEIVERLTGRKVTAFLSQTHLTPDVTVEMFLLDGPAPGFGSLEVATALVPHEAA